MHDYDNSYGYQEEYNTDKLYDFLSPAGETGME